MWRRIFPIVASVVLVMLTFWLMTSTSTAATVTGSVVTLVVPAAATLVGAGSAVRLVAMRARERQVRHSELVGATEAAETHEQLLAAERKLLEYESTVPFERESEKASRSSLANFLAGLAVVAVVVVVGVRDWVTDGDAGDQVDLTTGAGLARLGVVAASFYMAGQLFRRATVLQVRGQEFERAAIAMKVAEQMSQQLTNPDARDRFLVAIYERHLGGLSSSAVGEKTAKGIESVGSDYDVVKMVDTLNKLRGV